MNPETPEPFTNLQRFLLKLILLLSLSIGLYAFGSEHLPDRLVYAGFVKIGLFVATVTTVLHLGLMRRVNDTKAFIRYYMGATALKLLLYLFAVVLFAVANKAEAIPFALGFLYFYLVFTAFEVSESYQAFGTTR